MKKFKVTELKIVEGRIDQPNEFVEFSIGKAVVRYVVQRGLEDRWFVYEVFPSKSGLIKTLTHFPSCDKGEAVRFASEKMLDLVFMRGKLSHD